MTSRLMAEAWCSAQRKPAASSYTAMMSSVVVDAVVRRAGVHRHRPQGQSSPLCTLASHQWARGAGGMAAGAAFAHPRRLEQPTLGSVRSFST